MSMMNEMSLQYATKLKSITLTGGNNKSAVLHDS